MSEALDLGRPHTTGPSFRARAEARQRDVRAWRLRAAWAEWGHWLDPEAAAEGANFVNPQAFHAAKQRAAAGKGVAADRTFVNMLSSQAMCFNLFTPLAMDPVLAQRVLAPFFPDLAKVRSIAFEFTPDAQLLGDQSGLAGVDADLLIDGLDADGQRLLVTIETKFVEPAFSTCGYRKGERKRKKLPMCPVDVALDATCSNCLYVSTHGYQYWARTHEAGTLVTERLPVPGCAFGGPLWQLWVNHTLVHAEVRARGGGRAIFAVCAPSANTALLGPGPHGGAVLAEFRALLADPGSLVFVDLDALLASIAAACVGRNEWHQAWSNALRSRYAEI